MTENNVQLSVFTDSQTGVQLHQAQYSSTLPDPALLKAYEALLPGSASQIFEMAKKTHATRLEAESAETANRKSIVNTESVAIIGGQITSFVTVMAGLFVGAWLIYHGKDIAGLVSLVGPLATLAAVGIFKKKQ